MQVATQRPTKTNSDPTTKMLVVQLKLISMLNFFPIREFPDLVKLCSSLSAINLVQGFTTMIYLCTDADSGR